MTLILVIVILNSLNFKKKITYYKADKRYEGITKFNFKNFLLAIANIFLFIIFALFCFYNFFN